MRRAEELLERVGITRHRAHDYPHTFGRDAAARHDRPGPGLQPGLIVADEPTTALDVMIQAQILELLAGLSSELGMATIMVTHDLGVVGQRCDRVLVMYGGTIAEEAEAGACTPRPRHPYTQALLASFPTWRIPTGSSSRSPARPRGWTPCPGLPVRAALPDGLRPVPG